MKQLSHYATLGDAADGQGRGVEIAGASVASGRPTSSACMALQPSIDAISVIPICLLELRQFRFPD
jgi:hypothetical protein